MNKQSFIISYIYSEIFTRHFRAPDDIKTRQYKYYNYTVINATYGEVDRHQQGEGFRSGVFELFSMVIYSGIKQLLSTNKY